MPRNRLLKREFFRDEKVAALSLGARLLLQSLWVQADDVGNGRADSRLLRSEAFPYDDFTVSEVEEWLQETVSQNMVKLYEHGGSRYYHVVNFGRHQTIDRPSQFKHPSPPWLVEDSPSQQRVLDDEGKGKVKGQGKRKGKDKVKANAKSDQPDQAFSFRSDDLTKDHDLTCSKQTIDYFGFARIDRGKLGKMSGEFTGHISHEFVKYRATVHADGEPCCCSPVDFLEAVITRCQRNGVEYPAGILKIKKALERQEQSN